MVALAPDAERAYVSNIASGSVSVIDLAKGELVRVLRTAVGAEGIDVSPDGKEVWVGNRESHTISVIDVATLEVLATFDSKAFPIRLKFTPDGRHALVSNAQSGDVAVFDAKERKEVRRVPMAAGEEGDTVPAHTLGGGPVPIGILVHPQSKYVYVANTNTDTVTVIDLETWAVAGSIAVGDEPDGLAHTPRVFAAGEVSLLDE